MDERLGDIEWSRIREVRLLEWMFSEEQEVSDDEKRPGDEVVAPDHLPSKMWGPSKVPRFC
jgi:hypothetical protein